MSISAKIDALNKSIEAAEARVGQHPQRREYLGRWADLYIRRLGFLGNEPLTPEEELEFLALDELSKVDRKANPDKSDPSPPIERPLTTVEELRDHLDRCYG